MVKVYIIFSENVSVGKCVCRKISPSENWPSENVVVGKCSRRKICRRKICVGKFAVGKIVSENSPSENLSSEKPPDTAKTVPTENKFLNLVKSIKIGLYLIFSDWFGTKRNTVWLQINWKIINKIRFGLI